MHPFYLRVLAFIFFIISCVIGIKVSQFGFTDIESFKKLERLVPSKLIGVIEGENQLRGWVSKTSNQNYLRSPKTNTPSLYYRYLLEKEERDSDGDTRWVTIKDESKSVDFILDDHSATAKVYTADDTEDIRWFLPRRYFKESGSYRYSEWRIESGDWVSMFAWANVESQQNEDRQRPPSISLRFDTKGEYLPVVTTLSDAEVRADIGNTGINKIWLGVSLMALGLMCFIYATQVHRILVFLSLLTLFTMSILGVYGFASLNSDVRGGAAYIDSQQDKAELAVRSVLASQAITWQGWQFTHKESAIAYDQLLSWQQQRLEQIRNNLGMLQAIYLQQIRHFPENIYAWFVGIDQPSIRIELTEHEQSVIQQNIDRFIETKLSVFAYWWVLAGSIAFIIFTYFGFRYAKVKRMIENIPTSASNGVSYGLAEVKGKVKTLAEDALLGPLTKLNCVWYRYLIQERRGSGKNARWVTISDNKEFQRFYCEDHSGRFMIDPDEAEIVTRHKKVKRKGSMRYSEWLLKPNDDLYALGMAKVDNQKSDRLILGKAHYATDNADLFILTNYSEKEIMVKKASIAMLALACAFSGMFCAAVFFFGINGEFAATDYLLSALLAPLFLIFFMFVLHYNDIVFLQARAQRNWANIQVSLKKRADLLKQLVEVLSAYKDYEKELLEKIVLQRKQLKSSLDSSEKASDFVKREHEILQGMKLAVEAYPDLKADTLSLSLMDSLTDLENEVALMRTGFNDAVNHYNTRIESFPDVFLAKAFKFNKMELFRLNTPKS